ncbi:hypothetical protein JCM21900_003194 [Sporobolomyces salmonicolor]
MTAPAPPASRSAPPASPPASHSSKRELAAAAVVAKPSPSAQTQHQPATDVPLLTPSIEAIWASFRTSGQDTEMLKLLLLAKAKEDERLAALDHLRTEQLRAANTIALHQYWYQYQAFMAQAQARAQGQLPPYSPTSPPPSSKRPRAPSDASNSSTGDEQTSKKQRTFVAAQGAGRKPSHEAVMEALRRKCQANQSQSSVSAPAASSSSSSSSSSSHNSPPAPPEEASSPSSSHRPDQQQQQQPPSTRDKLAMLLHATDAAAAASLRNEAARTSDVRGELGPAAAAAAT